MADVGTAKNLKSGIYKIVNVINNKIYIGSSKKLYFRRSHHFSTLKKNAHHNGFLQHSYNKYGEQNFDFVVLEYCEESKLIEREQCWLDETKCCDPSIGYNLRIKAESSLGMKQSAEWIEKRAAQHRGKPKSEKVRLALSRLGSKWTESRRERARCYKHSDEVRHVIAEAGKGRRHTEESKLKMSRIQKTIVKKPHSQLSREKIRQNSLAMWAKRREFIGPVMPKKYKRRKFNTLSDSHKMNLRLAAIADWAKRKEAAHV